MERRELLKDTSKKMTAEEARKTLKAMRERDREIVRGKFNFHEVPGGSIKFNYLKYKEDDIQEYAFTDGKVYSIPRGVAEHLNKNGWYPIHALAKDEDGLPTTKIGKKVHRFSFTSLDFTDDVDLLGNPKEILTVESL